MLHYREPDRVNQGQKTKQTMRTITCYVVHNPGNIILYSCQRTTPASPPDPEKGHFDPSLQKLQTHTLHPSKRRLSGRNTCRGNKSPRQPSGDHSMVEPPGPIPNPEVKHRCADGSGAIGPVRVGRCQFYARLFPQRKKPGFFLPGKWPPPRRLPIAVPRAGFGYQFSITK